MKELRSVREEIRKVRDEVRLVRSEVGTIIMMKMAGDTAEVTDQNEDKEESEMEVVITKKEMLGDEPAAEATDQNEDRKESKMDAVIMMKETSEDDLAAEATDRNKDREESEMEAVITRKETSRHDPVAEATDRNKEKEGSKMGMAKKGRKKVARRKEEVAEDWCFVCKDGGELRICDYKQCLKSYHPYCVGKEDTFLDNEDHWCCAWHYCIRCRRSSHFQCYTCTTALCRHCLPIADFVPVKKEYGFCDECLKLAFLIEENKNHDSNGDTVDFTDRETVEGLFMEYYMIIKDQEGLKLSDLHAAENQIRNNKSGFDLEEVEDKEDEISHGDTWEKRHSGKKRRKEGKFTAQKCNKLEFIGWASKPLIEFLASIDKSYKEELSQREVTSIINDYVKENKLLHSNKKRKIMCDEKLQTLFKRKTMSKYKVYDYLEAHFAENIDDSDEDLLSDDLDLRGIVTPKASPNVNKRQKVTLEKKPKENEQAITVSDSCFAAIVLENMKLVYLKRLLLNELVNLPGSFKEKVTGSFVRIKANPNDYTARNSYQLLQVTGVKDVTDGETGPETILLLSAMPREISINLLSDGDITKEECEELRLKMVAGELERPTLGELLKKAKLLHEDITRFMIKKELNLLKNLIERANEKGWRRQLYQYFERRNKLQSPSEQAKMLEAVPTVIPDLSDLLDSTNSGNATGDAKSDDGLMS